MIKVYKLISGEELIGEVFNVLADSVELKNPATIVIQQTQKGMGVGLAPYMPYAEEEKVFSRNSAIAREATPAVNMMNEYSRIFGSGIQIASAGSVFAG